MEEGKIDILKFNNEIIVTKLPSMGLVYYKINELQNDFFTSYENFKNLVDIKLGESDQIFVSKQPVSRFAKIYDFNSDNKGFEEILYDDLNMSEKLVFDTFFNLYINN